VEDRYWRGAAEDEVMQDEHGFIWLAMLDTVDVDLSGKKVLDAGCNRGGFLRLLADTAGIAAGWGYDPAAAAVEDAKRLTGGRPLRYEAASSVPDGWSGFDVAFSHEVLYLLHDMPAHASAIFGALSSGGIYYAMMGVHAGSPLMREWHGQNRQPLDLPPLYDLDDVVDVFERAGFDAAVGQLRLRFIPVGAHRRDQADRGNLADWLNYYTRDKVLLRFARP
jgi:SAM-dependent methyltransferase